MRSPKADMLTGLIHSLSSSEKRYFRLYAEGNGTDKNYMKIFDAVDLEKVPGSGLIKWQQENAVKARYEKSYLQKILLKSLRNFNEDSSLETSFYQTLIDIENVFNKKQNDFALALIRKTIPIAEENESYTMVQELIRWYVRVVNRMHEQLEMASEFKSYMELAVQCLRKSENTYVYAQLSAQALALSRQKGYMAGDEELRATMEILSHPYFSDEEMALTFHTKIMFFNTQAICYTNISQHTKALDMVRKLVKHNETRPDKIKADPINYLMALGNWASIAINCGLFDEANKALDKLERLPRMKGVNMPKTTRDHIIGSVMERRIAMYVFHLQQYEKGIAYYHKTKADIEANGLDLHSSAMLWRHYELAMCYFFTGQYGPALEELRVYLHDHDDQRSDYLLCVHLLHIMVHYELGNLGILPHLVRAMRRFADTRGFIEKSIGIFAQLFNQLSKANNKKDVAAIAKSYISKFEALDATPQEHSICHSIAIERWLTSKI